MDGVWNLSSDQGNLGVFYTTSVRVVWHAQLAENFNVSIPYMQMKSITVRDSKFGQALVIETTARSGGYVLGFRIDPTDRLHAVAKEIQSLHSIYATKPNFGVKFTIEEKAAPLEMLKVARVADDVEIVGEDDAGDAFAAYVADAAKEADRPPVFSPELGLAIEALPKDYTIEALWKVK